MQLLKISGILALGAVLAFGQGQQQQQRRKRVLAIGETKGFQHDSVSQALASIHRWGKETGLWDTYIKTDRPAAS